MRFKGDLIELSSIQAMFQSQEQHMMQLFDKDIMLGATQRVQRDYIAEDLSNVKLGYCFLEDPRNSFTSYRNTLATHILQDDTLRARFTYRDHNGKLVWARAPVYKWLADYAKLSLWHLLRCEMLSGGPGRGTELTAMMYRTCKGRDVRNFVAIGGHIAMLRAYSKTSGTTGMDRIIPHSLDGFNADLLVQNLVLARPFAEFAAHIYWPNDKQVLFKYQNHAFVNIDKLFKTEDISNCMAEYTLEHVFVKLTVRSWRHIAIAFRRKLCPAHLDILEENDLEDRVAAEQTGHSVRTEKLNYGITPEDLLGAPEDVLMLYFEASKKWQIAMSIVPGKVQSCCNTSHELTVENLGGLSLTYTEAQSKYFQALTESGAIKKFNMQPDAPSVSIDYDLLAEKVAAKLQPKLLSGLHSVGSFIRNYRNLKDL